MIELDGYAKQWLSDHEDLCKEYFYPRYAVYEEDTVEDIKYEWEKRPSISKKLSQINENFIFECVYLTELEKKSIKMVYFDGLTQKSVSIILGNTQGRISQAIKSGINKIKKNINKHQA